MRNSSPVEHGGAENNRGLSVIPKLWLLSLLRETGRGRGALYAERRYTATSTGLHTSDYAGMSNDQTGENPVRRKPKVSSAR